ncbi:Predicted DNA-binding protein, MmcQ/YjbR family [Flavobacteriaceae bacterium MAR_2010_188]|nr:Predicted DNA-binding protein, MmcQ/YjbR family [Flavobacteriaceae bacterium MAR_2010_188]
MDVESIRNYCLSQKGVTESFPFDEETLVFKVLGKMFALLSLEKFEIGEGSINLKCDPEWSIQLREEYESITPGYHMNKQHWNTVIVQNSDIKPNFLKELIDHSYQLVFKSLPKKIRESLD